MHGMAYFELTRICDRWKVDQGRRLARNEPIAIILMADVII